MNSIGQTWLIAPLMLALGVGACAGKDQRVDSDRSSAGAPLDAGSSGHGASTGGGSNNANNASTGGSSNNASTGGSSNDASTGGSSNNASTGGSSNDAANLFISQLLLDSGKCLPRPIQEGNCKLLLTRTGEGCSCAEPGLTATTSFTTDAVRKQLELAGQCGVPDQPACADYCACEASRAIGTSLIECKTLPEPSPESTGWCYVSADAGEPQAELVADCPSNAKRALRLMGGPSMSSVNFLACSSGAALPRALGEVCFDSVSSHFGGFSTNEVTIDDRSAVCSSGFCVANHFQGLASCPYGQPAGGGDCLANENQPISVEVDPQLVERQAAVASICSCQCDGPGPGPYCTCPESMQCEHLVDDLGLGGANLAGSYCIPKGSEYKANAPRTECVEPNCGVKHPYGSSPL